MNGINTSTARVSVHFFLFYFSIFMATSSSSLSIVDYKRPFNVDASSITEYFCSVLASDGRSDRGALRNGNLLFKNHFVHSIGVSRRFIEITITAKCRAQMKKAVTYEVSDSKFVRLNTSVRLFSKSGCCLITCLSNGKYL